MERASSSRERTTPAVHRLGTVGSTQDEATIRLDAGERTPFTLTARQQRAGRGRLGRAFASPDGASLSLTHVHRTALAPAQRGWFPLAAGVAALRALSAVLGDDAAADAVALGLKWPNDLHTEDGRKLGGILVEGRGADAVLLGIGMNLRGPVRHPDGTAVPGAAWLWGEGGIRPGTAPPQQDAVREQLEDALAAALVEELGRLESAGGDGTSAGLRQRYTMACLTVGRAVRIDPLGESGTRGAQPAPRHGVARAIDGHGRLVVDLGGGDQVAVDVGDVRHLRSDESVRATTDDAAGVGEEEHGT